MLVEDIYKAIALLRSSITLLLKMMMLDDGHAIGVKSVTVSAEGRVENQKTQPNGSSAVVLLSFWFSTRFTRKIF